MSKPRVKSVRNLNSELCSLNSQKREHPNALSRSQSFRLPPTDLGQLLKGPCLKKVLPKSAEEQSIQEAKERVALRFLIKKSKRSRDLQPSCLARGPVESKGRLKTLMSSFKHSMKSTLTSSLPKTKTFSRMTSTLVNTLKSKHMPECLKYLGLANGTTSGITSGMKRKRDYEEEASQEEEQQQFNGKRPRENSAEDFNFVTPKMYECGLCVRNFYCARAYFDHIRRHKLLIRCEGCCESFSHVIHKRRHQLKCLKRAIL